jgi:hypothetical protein
MGHDLHSGPAPEPAERRPAKPAASDVDRAPLAPVPLPARPIVVGSAHDPAEAEADRMADTALDRLRRVTGEAEAEHGAYCGHVHRKAAPSGGSGAVVGLAGGALDSGTSAAIAAERGNGRPMAPPVLDRLQNAFGRNLQQVRIHDGEPAASLARSVSAQAFTLGSDIFFGRDGYDPGSPHGERMLAHEVAHTLQSAGTVHRWPFGKDEDPAEKQHKADAKAAKEKEKADEKARAKLAKATAKENKKLESGEAKHLKEQRKKGVAKRDELAKTIAQESKADKTTSATNKDLHKRFQEQLALEKATFDHLVNEEGMEVELARDTAYETAWIFGADPALNAVRPPRETAAERLTIDVRQARQEDKFDDQQLERGKLGGMLSKGVEEVYEKWELEAERLRKGPPAVAADMADYLAGKTVWEQAGPEIRKKRPTDPKIERQARIDARNRLAFGRRGAKKEESKLDAGADVTDKIESYGSKVLTGISKPPAQILSMIGKPIDKEMQANAGLPTHEKTLLEKAPIIGEPIDRVRHGQLKDDHSEKPISVETRASEGIGAAASVLTDLLSAVNGVMKVAQSISKAATERSTRAILGATKACNDGAKTAVSMAKDAAELAKVIDPGVSSAVGSVVPGLNIAISVLSIVSNAITLADMSMRMNDTNNSLSEARSRTPGAKKVDVMVYPLWHVHEVYAKKLEQACWSTAVSIANLVTSIATVASGGGYGIPAAVQAGVKVIDLLHSVGHFVADQVIVAIAKQSRVDSVAALEGAAETQLKRDPAMAIDGIVVSAKKGDAVAIKFLSTYGVKEDEVKNDKLGDIRKKVLAGIGEDADPKYFYESYKDKIVGVLTDIGSIGGRWQSTGKLAQDRNALDKDGSQRGWGWRVKMMFKGKAKYARSKAKTAAQKNSADAIECRVGKVYLLADATASEIETFVNQVEALSDAQVLDASGDPANSAEWREILVELLQSRIEKAAAAKTPAKVGA